PIAERMPASQTSPLVRQKKLGAEQRTRLQNGWRSRLLKHHVIPKACVVRARLKRALASLAHFVRCQGRRDDGRGPLTATRLSLPSYRIGAECHRVRSASGGTAAARLNCSPAAQMAARKPSCSHTA